MNRLIKSKIDFYKSTSESWTAGIGEPVSSLEKLDEIITLISPSLKEAIAAAGWPHKKDVMDTFIFALKEECEKK